MNSTGGAYGSNIRMLGSFDKLADLGHCFIAIDPKGFATGFEGRLSDLMETLRRTQPVSIWKNYNANTIKLFVLDRPQEPCFDSR
jgi:LDH2 family malate/lactate/ureidoglycolate dehydrogenase